MKVVPAPGTYSADVSRAEVRVADLLSRIEYEEPVVAYHSIHLTRHQYKRMSEIDFVVVWRDSVVAIEVKGGRIARENGAWRFTNRFGESNLKSEGPFEQARSGMFALRSRLLDVDPTIDAAFGCLVITPDQHLPKDLEWTAAEHAGPTALTVTGLKAAIDGARKGARQTGPKRRRDSYSKITRLLRPDFDLIPRLVDEAGRIEKDYVSLLETQYDVLAGALDNPRLICEGGAGTGKTLLAIESARRLSSDETEVALTCRSLSVVSMMKLLLSDSDVTCFAFDDRPTDRQFDLLIVDEAQDFMNDEDMLTLGDLVVGGISKGRWQMFSDPNNQAHVAGRFDERTYGEIREMGSLYKLSVNCRNTSPVITIAHSVIGADVGSPKIGGGPSVKSVKSASPDQTRDLLSSHLAFLRSEGVHSSDIAIVSLADAAKDSAVSLSRFDGLKVQTANEIKGLEAAHVCVVDVDDLSSPEHLARFYVAVTRPRISLWIQYSPVAWEQVKAAFGVGLMKG